ncbi:serine hydrolase domain-containing protein [Streptomyces flavofungini]|uniref:Beta-lactamase family protein n=1 Tax=Streptomyces flavofungini TaxID=68200 RepID=A0ABS0X087_9ACTN|nr:serine hydrolase domain-containing protein [Streptomyces flavofungini]MBJ3806509.1 beta-lactamase family protein [Streptomyces flavofungini]GHC85341.1 peptidase [Streptomyces flavofungini]
MRVHAGLVAALAGAVVLGLTAAAAPALASSGTPAPAAVAADIRSGPDGKALREAIAGLPDADATAALVRVRGKKASWHGSSGVRDLTSGRDANPEGRFRAGSTTKVVTAAVVLQLAAEGEVDLDAPVQRYLPDVFAPHADAFRRPISVRRLLNHSSGLRPGRALGTTFEELYARRFETLTPQEVAASSLAKGPAYDPGTRQEYLGVNYTLLGLLIEKVTGHSYEHEATRRVLKRAGMRHSSFPGTDPRIHGPHNRGYQAVRTPDGGTRLVDVTEWNQRDRMAGGDMISTTADLERLTVALFQGRIVPKPQLEEMFTVPSDIEGATMSAGLMRYEAPDGRVVWLKTGGRHGYNSIVAATRNLDTVLVYSVNSTDAKGQDMNPVAQRIIEAALKPARR